MEQQTPQTSQIPQNPMPQPMPPIPKTPPLPSDTKDYVFLILLFLESILFADGLFRGGFQLGFALGGCLIVLTLGLFAFKKAGKATVEGGAILLLTAALVASFAVNNTFVVKFFAVPTVALLFPIGLSAFTENAIGKTGTAGRLFDVINGLAIVPFGHVALTVRSILPKKGNKKSVGVFAVLLGLLCALPVLFILVPLLMASDAAFEGLMNRITLLDGETPAIVIFGCLVFFYVFTIGFIYRKGAAGKPMAGNAKLGFIPSAAVTAFLAVIDGCYLLYLFSQTAYFFSAFSGLLPAGFKVADYARRGFFEMFAICVINLILLTLAAVFTAKKEERLPRSVFGLLLGLGGFSIGMIAVSFSKMVLYMRSFGLSQNRLFTTVIMLVMLVILIAVLIRLFTKRFPYFKVIIAAVAIVAVAVSFADIDRVIAQYNTEHYRSGDLATLDVSYLSDLSDAAVPYLIPFADDKNDTGEAVRRELAQRYVMYYDEYGELRDTPVWQNWNYTTDRAKKLLNENKKKYAVQILALNDNPYRIRE